MSSSATILLLVSTIFQFATKIASFFFCGPFLVGGPKNIDQVHLFDLFSTFFFLIIIWYCIRWEACRTYYHKINGYARLA